MAVPGCGLKSSQDLNLNLAAARAVELDEEYPLPLAHLQLIVEKVESDAGGQNDRLAVRVAVLTFVIAHVDGADFEIVVVVFKIAGGKGPQPFLNVVYKQRFVFIDDYSRGCVQCLDVYQAIIDAALGDDLLHHAGDVDELELFARVERQGPVKYF